MSRLSRLAIAIERALESNRPVLVFGAWQPTDSLPAAVVILLLTFIHRLERLSLNPVLMCAPFTRLDDVALERSVRVGRVVRSRQRARVRRWQSGRLQPLDLAQCDWEVAAQAFAHADTSTKVGLNSFVAVDRIGAMGWTHPGARAVLGKHAKSGPRLPQLRVLTVRSHSALAVAALREGDLMLVGLTGMRGQKTAELTSAVLGSIAGDKPAVILVSGAGELARYSATRVFSQFSSAVSLAPAPSVGKLQVTMTGQSRVQHEKLFQYALPSEELTPVERELVDLALGLWRQQWRTVDATAGAWSIRAKFRQAFEDFRRRNPIAADKYNLLTQVLHQSEGDALAAAGERLGRVMEAVRQAVTSGSSRVLVVVGGTGEEAVVGRTLASLQLAGLRAPGVSVALSRQLGRMHLRADSVVVCGFYGPATLDGVLQTRPSNITWVIDPIEASQAAGELRRQAVLVRQLGLGDMADVLAEVDAAFRKAAAGTRAAVGDNDDHFVDQIPFFGRPPREDLGEDHGSRDEDIDLDADYLVVLADGTRLRVNTNRRFDVLRSQSPHPKVVRACDLQEGDQVLIVRNTYQQTLSELLLEQMDTTVLRTEAVERRTWVTIVDLAMRASGLSVDTVATRMRAKGLGATKQRVQAWLRADREESTPRDWVSFLEFARTIGITIAEEELQHYFNSIRRWRVGHQRRGRDVVRALRAAYFGGLSAADMVRIETDWGFGVRDLIEGCRVEEVESVLPLSKIVS